MPPETLQVVALGLIQGATELLPVSSSAHIAAVPQLLRWSVADWPPERRKELEVALHAGALLALAPSLWRARPDPRTLALSLAPPVLAGYALEKPIEAKLGGPIGLATGLVLGAAALAVADRHTRRSAASSPASSSGRLRRRRCGRGCRGRVRRSPRRGRSGTHAKTRRGSRSASPGPCSRARPR